MKAFLITLALCISSILYAQDVIFLQSLKSLSETQALGFADSIASLSKTKWELLKFGEVKRANSFLVYYINSELSEAEKEKAKQYPGYCKDCINIQFAIYYKGQNKDLEIEGVKKYGFVNVYGRYLDLFPTWKKYFKPEAELENTLTDWKSQKLKDYDNHLDFTFYKGRDLWEIRNQS